MNISEISLDRDQAKTAFLAYREQVQKRHSKEDEAIMRGYRALSQGKHLIHLTQTIKQGGTEVRKPRYGASVTLPRLAVCRAHIKWCWIVTNDDGSCVFQEKKGWLHHNARVNNRRLPAGTLGDSNRYTRCEFKAMVPVVPAELRPAVHLRNYHILWEAEWTSEPPIDPYLLKHIGGDLYAIVAHWNLTELERAIMSERVQ